MIRIQTINRFHTHLTRVLSSWGSAYDYFLTKGIKHQQSFRLFQDYGIIPANQIHFNFFTHHEAI